MNEHRHKALREKCELVFGNLSKSNALTIYLRIVGSLIVLRRHSNLDLESCCCDYKVCK